jgi:transcriptional regulator with XRE-family HTH domain
VPGMSDQLALTVARAIRAERARRGWSQTALAERLGWSQTKIAAIEGGTRRLYLHEMPEICRAFGVTLTRLLQDGDPADLQALGL